MHFLTRTAFTDCRPGLQRLLAHRTAQHWGLETSTVAHGPDQGRINATRTPATRPPQVPGPRRISGGEAALCWHAAVGDAGGSLWADRSQLTARCAAVLPLLRCCR
jgi:hypothetical protein